jgi:alpha-D-xyloside xylohydrolase
VFFAAKLQRDLDARRAAMDGSRFLIHVRGGGIGAQRLTFLWAGDQKRAFAKLDDQLLAMLNSGVSGVPFMTYDMAGYQYTGARQTVVGVVNDATGVVDTCRTTPASGESAVYRRLSTDTSVETEQKIFARGVEFTAMSPCMRQNGYVRQAFEFDSATAAIYQTYDALHASMTNAIAAFAQTIGTTGVPMVRPLVCDYQDDANTWDIEDEYLFLDRYLVAPVLTDATSREVYLPEGTWRERGSGTVYEAPASGRRVTLSVPIDALPVFEKQ